MDFAIFGAVGTTAGLIAFLTNTAESLYKKYKDFEYYEDRLDTYNAQIWIANQGLSNWSKI